MSWARTILTAYRWTGAVAYPFIGTYVAWRTAKGKEDNSRRRERYGITGRRRPAGPLVWVHAASVGETNAVVPLIERILESDINVVLTTGTITSAKVAEARLGRRIIHQYVPLDLKPAVSNFLNHWMPDLAIIAESEKRGVKPFLPPAVPFGSHQWPTLITPGAGPTSLADLP